MSSITERNGWYVPMADQVALNIILREVNDLREMLPLCKQKRRVIQAGGNIGIWPAELAKHFENVVTFEPDDENFECLEANVFHLINVKFYNAALGAEVGAGSMDRIDPKNIGAHQIDPGGDDFEIRTIDGFGFDDVDFIQLDVEGFEHFAILGGIETIKRCSPVICLELKGIGERYGHPDEDTINLLKTIGYTIRARIHRDIVFVRTEDGS